VLRPRVFPRRVLRQPSKITPQQVANDPRFDSNPLRRENMIKLINDPPGSTVPTKQSNALAMSMVQRMQPNYDGPDRITSTDQSRGEHEAD
jgi:hypothetical protein